MTKMMIKLGKLKPMKVKEHKTTAHAKGHMPAGKSHKTAKHA